MKKRQLRDDLDELMLRVGSLESRIEIRNEKRDGEIALLKATHEATTYWRERHEMLTQQAKSVKEERDGFSQQAKELREQLDHVARIRDRGETGQAAYWKTKCLEVAAERDELKRQAANAKQKPAFTDPVVELKSQIERFSSAARKARKARVPPRKVAAKKRGKR